jgi:hypothetical protein
MEQFKIVRSNALDISSGTGLPYKLKTANGLYLQVKTYTNSD